MDNLVLIRVVATLDRDLRGNRLESFRQESAERYRLRFTDGPVAVSLRPELPWLGRPAIRSGKPVWSPSPFASRCAHELAGLRLDGIEKPGPDRIAIFRFSGGRSLVLELATHGANLVLLGEGDVVEDAAHHPRGSAARVRAGERYGLPELPAGKLVPFGCAVEAIDAFLRARNSEGEPPLEAIRRHLFGVGTAAAELVLGESADTGESVGAVLSRRIAALARGELDPAVEGPGNVLEAAERGPLDPASWRLVPWSSTRGDAARIAGDWYEAVERGARIEARARALSAIVRRERRRTWDAERRAESDLRGFEDPERWRIRGEALLAGLAAAVRVGESVIVPDPYAFDGATLSVPAPPGISLTDVADECFRRHRRAKRGLEAARARLDSLRRRGSRLDALAEGEDACAADAERRLEAGLRAEGIAVGLRAGTRAQRAARAASLPAVDGVRLFETADGFTVLVGRTGRDNDRLTFKIAGPEDFWMHAAGVPGAHVVIRNPDRVARPPAATLERAAKAAAWFSDARSHGAVDVSWTRRKHVRRAKGAGPGTVIVKRAETVRVRPEPPPKEGE